MGLRRLLAKFNPYGSVLGTDTTQDGNISLTGNVSIAGTLTGAGASIRPVNAITAAGTVQGNAALLAVGLNLVSGANGTKGVILPTMVAGEDDITIKALPGTGDLKLYPPTGGTINAIAANGAYTIGNGTVVEVFAGNATALYTKPAVAS